MWCRVVGDELVIVGRRSGGLIEIARHRLSTPGRPRIADEHYPAHRAGNGPHLPRPRARTAAEVAFLALGDGAERCLIEAAGVGAQRVRSKMARAVELASLLGTQRVEQALGLAAVADRFAVSDLASIPDHLAGGGADLDRVRADESHSAQPGTSGWEAFGR